MNVAQFLLAELESEGRLSRRALEHVPDDSYEWAPHERSMKFGYLADMVANIPTWVAMIVERDSLDVNPPAGSQMQRERLTTSAALLGALEQSMAAGRAALQKTSDDHLKTSWQLLAGGTVVIDAPRETMIRDTINHWIHHRGQMTVYLRLMGAKVPALYGPSADDTRFA